MINMTSVPSSTVPQLVNHKFTEDRYIPHNGEIILLSETLQGLALLHALSPICRFVLLPAITTTQFYYHLVFLYQASSLLSSQFLRIQLRILARIWARP